MDEYENQKCTEEHSNKALLMLDDIDYWQDKLLEIKMKIYKQNKVFDQKKKIDELQYNKILQINSDLKQDIELINNKLNLINTSGKEHRERIETLKQQIKDYEENNSNLHNEFLQKMNYIKTFENPENLMKHILKLDPDIIKNLCIKLNKLQNEKMNYYITIQKQYYNHMYYNQFMYMGTPNNNPESNN